RGRPDPPLFYRGRPDRRPGCCGRPDRRYRWVRSTAPGRGWVRSTAGEGGEDRGEDFGAGAADRVGVAGVASWVAGGEGRDHGGDPVGVGSVRAEGVADCCDRCDTLAVQLPWRRGRSVPEQRDDFLEAPEPGQLDRVAAS